MRSLYFTINTSFVEIFSRINMCLIRLNCTTQIFEFDWRLKSLLSTPKHLSKTSFPSSLMMNFLWFSWFLQPQQKIHGKWTCHLHLLHHYHQLVQYHLVMNLLIMRLRWFKLSIQIYIWNSIYLFLRYHPLVLCLLSVQFVHWDLG